MVNLRHRAQVPVRTEKRSRTEMLVPALLLGQGPRQELRQELDRARRRSSFLIQAMKVMDGYRETALGVRIVVRALYQELVSEVNSGST